MKSQRRHELRENVLAHELVQVKNFFNKYGNWIFGLVAAAMIVWLIVWFYQGRMQKKLASEQTQYENSVRALYEPGSELAALKVLGDLVEKARDPLLKARSAVALGAFYCRKHQIARGVDSFEAQEAFKEAKRYYQLVIDKHSKHTHSLASSHIGLGTLAEDAGDQAGAKLEYEKAVKLVDHASPLLLEAEGRLKALEDFPQPIKLATSGPAEKLSTEPAEVPVEEEPAP